MDQYHRLRQQINLQTENTRSRINLYKDPLPFSYQQNLNYQISPYPSQIKIHQETSVGELPMNPNYPKYSNSQIYNPNNNTQPNQNLHPPSFLNTYQIPLIKILPQLNSDNSHHYRMRAAQAQAIRRQQESNRIRRNKQKHDKFFENSSIIQNQVEHYPYGNIHGNIMQKIVARKAIQDRNNQQTLLRFIRETEEFKKSKSKQIKNMLLQPKQYVRQNEIIDQFQQKGNYSVRTKNQRLQKPMRQSLGQYNQSMINKKPMKISQDKMCDSSIFQSCDSYQNYENQYKSTIRMRSQNVPSPIKICSPIKNTKINKKPKYHLYPLTNEGQDGLKIIRRNLRLRSELNQSQHQQPIKKRTNPYLNQYTNSNNYDPSKQMQQLQSSLLELSSIIKHNKDNLNISHNNKNKSINQRQNSQQSKQIKKTQKGKSIIDPEKMRKYLQRLSNNNDAQLKENKQYLEYLSSVVN